jgi:O-acetyl-ADP-ribose deacetylase (regulator of RNase III)
MERVVMIREAEGNLLRADVDALVNTVNTVGVMGKGIALQFKRAYPEMFAAYERAAKAGDLEIGRMHVWETGALDGPRVIINVPTKRHWRAPSRLADIDAGLVDLLRVIREHGIRSIALPPLGCGNGGLDWSLIAPRIWEALAPVAGDVDVLVYPPAGAPPASEMVSVGESPPMTPGRAALIALMREYELLTFAAPSLIESQKLMYFLQEAGEPLRLRYARGLYGPYADNLRATLRELEGHYISGFGDGSAAVLEAEPLEVMTGAFKAAEPVLVQHPETQSRIKRVLELAEGFDSAYGLELLASVHWVVKEDPAVADDSARAVQLVQSWTHRKARLFTTEHITAAWNALRDRGWLPISASASQPRTSAQL